MKKYLAKFLLILLVCSSHLTLASQTHQGAHSSFEKELVAQGMVDITVLDNSYLIDLKYATTDNFTKEVLYDSMSIAYLHPLASKKLAKAHQLLKEINPDYRFMIYDCARPLSVQKKMFKVVENTKYSAYVANPSRTGLHNYGMAVDLTICDENGKILDMGTAFDYFGSAAGTNKEQELITRGVLTAKQVKNRQLLRKVMVDAGYQTIRGEWWHFNAVSLAQARASYRLIE